MNTIFYSVGLELEHKETNSLELELKLDLDKQTASN